MEEMGQKEAKVEEEKDETKKEFCQKVAFKKSVFNSPGSKGAINDTT